MAVDLPLSSLSAWRARWAASSWAARGRDVAASLRDALPAAWVQRFWPRRPVWWLQPQGEGWVLDMGQGATLPLPAEADLWERLSQRLRAATEPPALWVRVPADHVLQRRLTLPEAARTRLRAVLAHEIDRQTPFVADQVVFAAQAGVATAGQCAVTLIVLPRDRLQALLARLGPLGTAVNGVAVAGAAATADNNLLPESARAPLSSHHGRVHAALLAGIVMLLIAVGHLTLANREGALQALEAARDASSDAARDARRLRNQLQEQGQAAGFLAARRQRDPLAIAVLADVTERLDDSVYLERFSIERDRVVLGGVARSASTVVAALQDSPFLGEPALVGAVQADAASGRDRFTLSAERRNGVPDGTP